jgi:WD40 repeat protein
VSASADDTLKVWELETGRELHTLAGHINDVNAVAVTPDGRRAVSASDDGTLKVWELETGRELHTRPGCDGRRRARPGRSPSPPQP